MCCKACDNTFASTLQEQSHKSYRPLCVLSFRLNYALHQLEPLGYHLVNMLLHCLVCLMFFR
jgi:protein O-mannosyl-transferase